MINSKAIVSMSQKQKLTELFFNILSERAFDSQKNLAQFYDPDKMPECLRKAHHTLDIAIEQCYKSQTI